MLLSTLAQSTVSDFVTELYFLLSRDTAQVSGKRPTHMQNGHAGFSCSRVFKNMSGTRVSFARFLYSIVMNWHKIALSGIIALKIPKIPSPNDTDQNFFCMFFLYELV